MDRLAEVCERMASHADVNRKHSLINEYLNGLEEHDRAIAQRFLSTAQKPLLTGTTLTQAVFAATGWDVAVVRACREAATDTAEMAALLLAGVTRNEPLSLENADALYREFSAASKPATKKAILLAILPAHRPLTLKYFLRKLTGHPRIGLPDQKVQVSSAPGEHRLLAVITSAEQGRGKLATSLSDYTLGVRSGDQFVNVGKAPGAGYREIRQLTRVLRKAALERFGRVVLVKPEVVLEVAFVGVQQSRHKGGYSLVSPQITSWKRDKKPEDCDDLDRLKQLFELTNPPGAESPSLQF